MFSFLTTNILNALPSVCQTIRTHVNKEFNDISWILTLSFLFIGIVLFILTTISVWRGNFESTAMVCNQFGHVFLPAALYGPLTKIGENFINKEWVWKNYDCVRVIDNGLKHMRIALISWVRTMVESEVCAYVRLVSLYYCCYESWIFCSLFYLCVHRT